MIGKFHVYLFFIKKTTMEVFIPASLIFLLISWIIYNIVQDIRNSKKGSSHYKTPVNSYGNEVYISPWKTKYNTLTENFNLQQVETFYNEICKLAQRYKYPPNARSISYQFLAKQNSNYALLLYLQYLHVKTDKTDFRHKKVSEEYKKILFRNKTQISKFQQLCDELKTNRDLEQVINDTKRYFRINRREISLNAKSIKEVGREHTQTAALLGKYLEDEPEIMEKKEATPVLQENETNEAALFRLFEQHHFTLNKKEIDDFAQQKGVFAGSLIQQINETYYETLDDLLIEEDDDNYILNEPYYESIKS